MCFSQIHGHSQPDLRCPYLDNGINLLTGHLPHVSRASRGTFPKTKDCIFLLLKSSLSSHNSEKNTLSTEVYKTYGLGLVSLSILLPLTPASHTFPFLPQGLCTCCPPTHHCLFPSEQPSLSVIVFFFVYLLSPASHLEEMLPEGRDYTCLSCCLTPPVSACTQQVPT